MSNPFAPPGPSPQPIAQPSAQPVQQAGAQPFQQVPYGAPGQAWAPQQPFTPAPKQGNGLAITAIVLSGLALVSVLAIAAVMAAGSFASMGSSGWVLSGEVTPIDKGATDLALEQALTLAIEDDGGTVNELACPARSQVGQGLVTVCHGSVDEWDWTGVVVFEDDSGTFIVTEY